MVLVALAGPVHPPVVLRSCPAGGVCWTNPTLLSHLVEVLQETLLVDGAQLLLPHGDRVEDVVELGGRGQHLLLHTAQKPGKDNDENNVLETGDYDLLDAGVGGQYSRSDLIRRRAPGYR